MLVVDDDPAVVEKLREVLESHGVTVHAATNAESAIRLLGEHELCGLVLDLVLESGSGFDVLHHLSKQKMAIPTIVVTAKLPSYVREMLNAEQVKLVFPKPVDARLLGTIVLGLCG